MNDAPKSETAAAFLPSYDEPQPTASRGGLPFSPSDVRCCLAAHVATDAAEAIEAAKRNVARTVATEIEAKLIEHDYFVTENWGDGMVMVRCQLNVIVPPRGALGSKA